jgi:anthranilate phosphoribosyltransferase
VRTFEITPEDFGFRRGPIENARGNDIEGNAAIIRAVLNGERNDEARSLVIVNAAAALHVGGSAADLREGARQAEESIDSGQAYQKLADLIRITNATN